MADQHTTSPEEPQPHEQPDDHPEEQQEEQQEDQQEDQPEKQPEEQQQEQEEHLEEQQQEEQQEGQEQEEAELEQEEQQEQQEQQEQPNEAVQDDMLNLEPGNHHDEELEDQADPQDEPEDEDASGDAENDAAEEALNDVSDSNNDAADQPEDEQPEDEQPEDDHEDEQPEDEQPADEQPEDDHEDEQPEDEHEDEDEQPEDEHEDEAEQPEEQEQEHGVSDGSAGIPFVMSKASVRERSFERSFNRGDSSGGSDVFSRLSSHMTGTHKHGGRRAVSIAHSSRLQNSSVYGGGAARNRSWLKISEETPGITGDPYESSGIARTSMNRTGTRMSTSSRFRPTDAKGCYRSKRDLEDERNRAQTYVAPAEFGASDQGSGSAWSKTDRFVARSNNGQFLSKRDLEAKAARGEVQTEVFSSFKLAGEKTAGANGTHFGGTVHRFRNRTQQGHFLSSRDKADESKNDPNKTSDNDLLPAYSSFAKSSVKQSKSSHFGGSTGRFVDTKKKNGGLITPGPGAFELNAPGTKGYFGQTSSHNPISLLA